MMMPSNVARDPELAARLIIEIVKSGPPTSFQLVILPVKIWCNCSVVRLLTDTFLLTITARPATATW